MSGFVAVCSTAREHPVNDNEIEELVTSYVALRGDGARHEARAGDTARLVKIDNPHARHPGIERRGDSWSAVTGTAHGPSSLVGARPEELDGQFSLFAYDATEKRISIASDPFGFHALYAARGPNRLLVSNSALALARYLNAEPDRLGILSFLRSGYHFGKRTNWEGIERLDPAEHWVVDGGKVEKRRYWLPEVDRSVRDLSFDRAVDHCIEASTAAIASHLRAAPPAWSDLTGGYDSRAMNLLLERSGVTFATTTRDTPMLEDIEIAQELSRLGGWEWLHTKLPEDWHDQVVDEIDVALGWADANLEVLQLARVLWPHRVLAETKPLLISSGGGEHLQYYAWKSEFLRAGRSNRLHMDNFIDMGMLRPTNTSLFASDPTREVREDFRRRLSAYAAPYSDQPNTVQADMLYAYKGMGHFGAYAASDSAYLTAEVPFYFKDVFSAAFSTNFRYRNNHRLFRHFMHRLNPKLASVRTSRGGPAIPQRATNLHLFWPYYAQVGRKAINKISHKATGKTFLAAPPPTWLWEDRANNSVLDHLGRDVPFKAATLRSAPLYDHAALDAFLVRARQSDFTQTPMLGRIITIEMALRAVDQAL
ncbi:MAG: hypothetical protein M3198_03045 [Actinomycetota bacterium]|nr:hypothetical protein [Actinomycetota bacterium]